jgi:4-hydroxy-3-polyprenylbenzoate decarboxylase
MKGEGLMRLVVGISGGSGALYGVAMLKVLRELGIETHLVVSDMGKLVILQECGIEFQKLSLMADYCYSNADLEACIASGSFKTDGMIIVPCSMKTLAALAHGYSEGLLTRAGDVVMKEGRRLVVVPREMPLGVIHLENMLTLARLGVRIMPPSPGFYSHPETIEDIVKIVVGRILDQFDIEHNLLKRWGMEI